MRSPYAVIGLAIAMSTGCSASSREPALRVAAAADLKFALDDIIRDFSAEHKGAVDATYGSSGNFYAQLTNKAPFDVFLSADSEYPRRLIEAGLARTEDLFLYAYGRLALVVGPRSGLDPKARGMDLLLDQAIRKVAIGNPRHAPYGRAAEAALRKRGLYERVQPKLVYGENIAQAAQYVESGAADAGLVALSLVTPTMRAHEVPPADYPTLEQAGIILSTAADRDLAVRFCAFLRGPRGRAILNRRGFDVPKG